MGPHSLSSLSVASSPFQSIFFSLFDTLKLIQPTHFTCHPPNPELNKIETLNGRLRSTISYYSFRRFEHFWSEIDQCSVLASIGFV